MLTMNFVYIQVLYIYIHDCLFVIVFSSLFACLLAHQLIYLRVDVQMICLCTTYLLH